MHTHTLCVTRHETLLPINEPTGYIQRLAEYKRRITLRSSALLVKPSNASVTMQKNMSEYVVCMVKERDVRHTSVEAIEREVLEG